MGMFDSLRIEGNILPTHPILEKYGIDPNALEYQTKDICRDPFLDVFLLRNIENELQLWWIGNDSNGGYFPPKSFDKLYCRYKEPTFEPDINSGSHLFTFGERIDLPIGCTWENKIMHIDLEYKCKVKNGIVTDLKIYRIDGLFVHNIGNETYATFYDCMACVEEEMNNLTKGDKCESCGYDHVPPKGNYIDRLKWDLEFQLGYHRSGCCDVSAIHNLRISREKALKILEILNEQ